MKRFEAVGAMGPVGPELAWSNRRKMNGKGQILHLVAETLLGVDVFNGCVRRGTREFLLFARVGLGEGSGVELPSAHGGWGKWGTWKRSRGVCVGGGGVPRERSQVP